MRHHDHGRSRCWLTGPIGGFAEGKHFEELVVVGVADTGSVIGVVAVAAVEGWATARCSTQLELQTSSSTRPVQRRHLEVKDPTVHETP